MNKHVQILWGSDSKYLNVFIHSIRPDPCIPWHFDLFGGWDVQFLVQSVASRRAGFPKLEVVSILQDAPVTMMQLLQVVI